ncbi:MAG: glycosyltransferase 87 family protein [Patescibacteria group bacterium]
MKKLLILAFFLRVLVSAFLYHPDIKTFNFQSSFLKKGVFNIYSYLVDNKKDLPFKEEFVYFPLTYFAVGGYQALVTPFLGSGFNEWIVNADSSSIVTDPNIFKYLIVLKLPYLALDILIAYLLLNYFEDKKKGQKAFIFWLFNPITIFIIYAFGNVDIFPVVLTLVSLSLIKKEKMKLAALTLGLAAGFKLYPLLFAPFLALSGRTTKEKITFGVIPFLVFIGISLPFLSTAFFQSTLISGLTTRMFYPSFEIGFGESIIAGLLAITTLFFYTALIDKKRNPLNYWIVLFMLLLSFSHFHIQWLLWVAPFLIILAVKKPKLNLTILALAVSAFIIPFLYEDRFMSMGLFRIYSLYFDLLPTPFLVLRKVFDPYSMQSIFHSLFAGGTLVMTYLLFKKES